MIDRIFSAKRLGLACLAALLSTAIPARADAPCDPMFKITRDFLSYDHRHYTSVFWTTTYLTKRLRFMGTTMMPMRVQGGDLVAAGTRTRTFEYPSTRSTEADTEAVSINIRPDGKVMLNKIYGPYDPTCFDTAAGGGSLFYMVLKTGDSIEVFNFYPRNDGRF